MDKKKIDKSEFEKFLTSGGELKNIHVETDLKIQNRGYKKLKFSDCIFSSKLHFQKTSFFEDLDFFNCEFSEEITFEDVNFKLKYKFEKCNFLSKIIFINPSFNGFTVFDCKAKEIVFKGSIDSVDNQDGIINFIESKVDKIVIKSKKFNCNLKLIEGEVNELSFWSSEISKSLSFDKGVQINNLFFESSNFHERIDFHKCKLNEHAYIHKSSFYEQVVFNKECEINYITFANVYAKHSVSIHYAENLQTIDISDSNFESSFSCYNFDENSSIDNGFSCNINGVIHGNIVFEGVPATSLSIGAMNFGNLYFNRVRTKLIFLQDFHNNDKLTISNIRIDPNYNLLLIYDSNINNTEFVNINFKKFDEIVIAKSNVSNLVLSNSLFPSKIHTETKAPKLGFKIEKHEKINNSIYYRESYRQLKLAMEKQGNRNLALRFKAKEMHYLRKELTFGWDKILLTLNFISNNHGISWFRGVIFTFGVAFIFFSIYNETLPKPFFYWDFHSSFEQTKSAFWIGLDAFSKFISTFPTLRLDDNSNTWQTNMSVLASRIFIGYGIYQTITSFRKYGGK